MTNTYIKIVKIEKNQMNQTAVLCLKIYVYNWLFMLLIKKLNKILKQIIKLFISFIYINKHKAKHRCGKIEKESKLANRLLCFQD